jgi:YD repeat-containing protein
MIPRALYDYVRSQPPDELAHPRITSLIEVVSKRATGREQTVAKEGRPTTNAELVKGLRPFLTGPWWADGKRHYDAAGNRTTLVDPDGGIFTATFDALNRTETLKNPDGAIFTSQYDAGGRRTTLLLGLGSKRQYQYDAADRLTTQIELSATSAPILTMVDTYDSVGNRTGRNKDGTVTTWTYDDIYRLTGQQQTGAWATFSYDQAGNLEVKWHQGTNPMTFMHDAANRITTMLQGTTITSFTYDNNGNLTEENAASSRTTYSFDRENRLTGVRYSDGTRSTYTYAGGFPVEGEGLRRSAHEPGGSLTTFVWDGSDYVMEKT